MPAAMTISALQQGGTLSVVDPLAGHAYFVMGRRAGSGTELMLLSTKDITAGWTIPDLCLGLEICLRTVNLSSFSYADTDFQGPILHATMTGTTVTNAAGFNTAIADTGISTIILGAGTVWDGATIPLTGVNRSATPVVIKTPQSNPAKFLDQSWPIAGASGITLSGLDFHNTAAFEASNSLDMLEGNAPIILEGCKFRGDELTEGQKNDTTGYPSGTPYFGTGMNFLPQPFAVTDSKGWEVNGCLFENIWALDVGTDVKVRRSRVRGFYFDLLRMSLRNGSLSGDRILVSDLVVQDCYAMYDEIDWSGGSGNSPHPDLFQYFSSGTGTTATNAVFEDVIYTIGQTRAAAASALGGQTMTAAIMNAGMIGSTFRNVAAAVRGSITTYVEGSDGAIDRASIFNLGDVDGSGGVRFGASAFSGEALVSNSLLGGAIASSLSTDGYLTEANTADGILATATDYIQRDAVPPTALDVLLYMRPKVDDGKGAVTPTGYLRTLGALPAAPSVATETATEGGFNATLNTVSGATIYSLRWRVVGGSAWTVVSQASPAFVITGAGSLVNVEYQARVTTADGPSPFMAIETVTTLTVPPLSGPAVTLLGSGIHMVSDTVAASANATRNHVILGASPDTAKVHLAISIIDQLQGTGLNFAAQKGDFIDASNADLADLTESQSYRNAPGGSVIATYIGYGTPASNVRGSRVVFTPSGNTRFASGLAMFQFDDDPDMTAVVVGGSGDATNNTKSVTLNSVPAGSRIIAMAYTKTAGAVAFTAGVTEIDDGIDPNDANGVWIVGTGETTGGGTVTVTATDCWSICAIAVPNL